MEQETVNRKADLIKKTITGFALACLFLYGCASPPPAQKQMAREYWTFTKFFSFFPDNLLSSTPEVRQKAFNDFKIMDPPSKQRVLTYLAYTLGDEQDPEIRRMTFNVIRDLKAGEYIVVPLILAYGNNNSDIARREIKRFIMEYNPSKFDLDALKDLLNENKWETKLMAMEVISMMKAKAGPAFPDITEGMCQTGPSYGIYAECYDFAESINKDATMASVALDIKNKSDRIRESALRKLNDIFKQSRVKTKAWDIAFHGIVRALYSDDAELSSIARGMLTDSAMPEAVKAVNDYDAIMSMKVAGMKDAALKKAKLEFANEETGLYAMLKAYYEKVGRSDAAKKLKE